MNPPVPPDPPDDREARLTAFVLGELPPAEAGQIREELARDPELARLYQRLKQASELVREAEHQQTADAGSASVPLRMSEDRRQRLLAHFKSVPMPQSDANKAKSGPSWFIPASIAALLMALLTIGGLSPFARSRVLIDHLGGPEVSFVADDHSVNRWDRDARKYSFSGMTPPPAERSSRQSERDTDADGRADAPAQSSREHVIRKSGDEFASIAKNMNRGLASIAPQPTKPPVVAGTPAGPGGGGGGQGGGGLVKPEADLRTAGEGESIVAQKSTSKGLNNEKTRSQLEAERFHEDRFDDYAARQKSRDLSAVVVLPAPASPPSAPAASPMGGAGADMGVIVNDDALATGIALDGPKIAQPAKPVRLRGELEESAQSQTPAVNTPAPPASARPSPKPMLEPGLGGRGASDISGALLSRSATETEAKFLNNAQEPQAFAEERMKLAQLKDSQHTARGEVLGERRESLELIENKLRVENETAPLPLARRQEETARVDELLKNLEEHRQAGGPLPGTTWDLQKGPATTAGATVEFENLGLARHSAGWAEGAKGALVGSQTAGLPELAAQSDAEMKNLLAKEAGGSPGEAMAWFGSSVANGTYSGYAVGEKMAEAADKTADSFYRLSDLNGRGGQAAQELDKSLEDLRTAKVPPDDWLKLDDQPTRRQGAESRDGLSAAGTHGKDGADQAPASGGNKRAQIVLPSGGAKAGREVFAYAAPTDPMSVDGTVVLYDRDAGGRPTTATLGRTERHVEGTKEEAKAQTAKDLSLGVNFTGIVSSPQTNALAFLVKEKENGAATVMDLDRAEILDEKSKPAPATPPPIPQPEIRTLDNAFSTFSLNVSDVSFKLAGASLEKGAMPDAGSIRSEEFINAFDYRDPEPGPGMPIAFAWERARYPFAHRRDALRFSVKTAARGREAGRPLNLVLLLDNSGSMERADRVRIIREALRILAAQLKPQDKISVVVFSRTARLWADGLAGDQAEKLAGQLADLAPQGGTNLEEALKLAYATALKHYLANGVNRVVLLTDGAANLGEVNPETLQKEVEKHRRQGVALDCFGIGWEGYNDDLLEVLARHGDGRYGFVNSVEEAGREFAAQLAGALQVAAADVKVQVEFNPRRVTAYRQVGYAKHQLKKEQFRDNTVDAAEIGAAEAGNGLYIIEVNDRGEGPLAVVRVRYRDPGTGEYHEREWEVAHSTAVPALEKASPAMRLLVTSAAFSEWLAGHPCAAEVSTDRLLALLAGVPEFYGADNRPARLEWMIRQAKSISGR